MLTFIIPVIAEEISDNYNLVLTNLGKTLASVGNQTNADWRALVVSQSRPNIDYIENRIVFVPADFPPAKKYPKDARLTEVKRAVCRRANDLDRARKVRVAAQALHRYRTDFVMVLEADDLVSNRLCEFVAGNGEANGWSIEKGYVWDGKSEHMQRTDHLTSMSGSSWVAKVFYEMLPEKVPLEIDPTTLSLVQSGCPFLNSGHRNMKAVTAQAGKPLEVLPFRGLIYHKGHGANLSQKYTPVGQSLVRRLRHRQRHVLAAPSKKANRVYLTKDIRSEFAINDASGGREKKPSSNGPFVLAN